MGNVGNNNKTSGNDDAMPNNNAEKKISYDVKIESPVEEQYEKEFDLSIFTDRRSIIQYVLLIVSIIIISHYFFEVSGGFFEDYYHFNYNYFNHLLISGILAGISFSAILTIFLYLKYYFYKKQIYHFNIWVIISLSILIFLAMILNTMFFIIFLVIMIFSIYYYVKLNYESGVRLKSIINHNNEYSITLYTIKNLTIVSYSAVCIIFLHYLFFYYIIRIFNGYKLIFLLIPIFILIVLFFYLIAIFSNFTLYKIKPEDEKNKKINRNILSGGIIFAFISCLIILLIVIIPMFEANARINNEYDLTIYNKPFYFLIKNNLSTENLIYSVAVIKGNNIIFSHEEEINNIKLIYYDCNIDYTCKNMQINSNNFEYEIKRISKNKEVELIYTTNKNNESVLLYVPTFSIKEIVKTPYTPYTELEEFSIVKKGREMRNTAFEVPSKFNLDDDGSELIYILNEDAFNDIKDYNLIMGEFGINLYLKDIASEEKIIDEWKYVKNANINGIIYQNKNISLTEYNQFVYNNINEIKNIIDKMHKEDTDKLRKDIRNSMSVKELLGYDDTVALTFDSAQHKSLQYSHFYIIFNEFNTGLYNLVIQKNIEKIKIENELFSMLENENISQEERAIIQKLLLTKLTSELIDNYYYDKETHETIYGKNLYHNFACSKDKEYYCNLLRNEWQDDKVNDCLNSCKTETG